MSVFDLNSANTTTDRLDPSARIASFVSSVRDSNLPELFSFKGRLDRGNYWMALLWAHLVPMIACLPFVAWRVLWPPRGFGSGGLGTPGNVVCAVSGAIYYWMLAAAFVKRFHDIGLSGWLALTYLSAVFVFVFELSIGEDQHWPILLYLVARYFRPVLWMARDWLSAWEALMCYLTPYVFLALLVVQGTIKGTAEPDGTRRKTVVIALIALALSGGVAEACYGWYGVYRKVTPEDDAFSFSMNAHRVEYRGYGEIAGVEGLSLFLEDSGSKRVEVPLVSQSVVGGRIETRDFGTLKVEGGHFGGSGPRVLATRSQIARLRTFQSEHQ